MLSELIAKIRKTPIHYTIYAVKSILNPNERVE